MGTRWDDLGTVSYFHGLNFPGREQDSRGALEVFSALFKGGEVESGSVIVRQIDDRTERYLSYWLVLGVIDDYEVTGMGNTTRYQVKLHQTIKEFQESQNEVVLQDHLLNCLHSYMSRYRPYTVEEVSSTIEDKKGSKQLSSRFISSLIDFIYDRIAYQRRESIRTMVDFCNQEDRSPERLRKIIKSYFDESKKFTPILSSMTEDTPSPDLISRILTQIEGFDDVEHLYWETRRLLDERFRSDWALINFFTMLYRERVHSKTCQQLLATSIDEMVKDSSLSDSVIENVLAVPLALLVELEMNGTMTSSVVGEILEQIFESYAARFDSIIEALSESPEIRSQYSLALANKQIERVIYAARFEQIA